LGGCGCRIGWRLKITTKTLFATPCARQIEERVIMKMVVKNRVNNKGDIWLTLCKAEWGEGGFWRWWWKIGLTTKATFDSACARQNEERMRMKMVAKNQIGLTTKATFDLPCARQNEERVRMKKVVKNRVNNKGDIWVTLCKAEWVEGENEEGGEK
jgi:hypothetical protein